MTRTAKSTLIFFKIARHFLFYLLSISEGCTISFFKHIYFLFQNITMSQKCIKCKRTNHLLTCHGCQQIFCNEHIIGHREELSIKINNINKEYHHLEEDLNANDLMQTYLSRIDQWEHESINKIQKTAEIARNDLLKFFDRIKTQLKSSAEKINHDMKSTGSSEMNLNKWMEQLQQLRYVYKASLNDDIIDDNRSSIRLIKILDKKQSLAIEELKYFPREKFEKIVGGISLSEDRLTATCTKRHWNGSTISGSNLYVSGIHSIRFRIIKKGAVNPFFGISTALKEPNPWNRKTPAAFGWSKIPMDDDKQENIELSTIESGYEVTLTLNCTNNEIEFENHQTKQYVYESISYEQCPFPWRIAIVLYTPGDSVSILST
jgi:hypothetical protein